MGIEKFVECNGIKIAYDTDREIDPAQTYLLFLHGLQTNKEGFNALRQDLLNNLSFPHLAIDLVGFGHSDKPQNFSYDLADQTAILIKILNALHLQKVHVVGHSLGGMIGTLLLKELPNHIQSLCSMEGNLKLDDCGESKIIASMSFDYFKNHYFKTLKTNLENSNQPNKYIRLGALNPVPDFVFYQTGQSIVTWANTNQLFDTFMQTHQPKILLRGEKGNFSTLPTGPTIENVIIANAGHFVHLDNPVETSNAIINFLSKINK
ncbi:MAG: alpha/beta hydrolase [Alphaproteobacteria bacterium]|nr:alpha/beta hydrolase [Alphaproteobacteria bacterium]